MILQHKRVSIISPGFLMNEMKDAFRFGRSAGMRDAVSILRPSVCVLVMCLGTCRHLSNMCD